MIIARIFPNEHTKHFASYLLCSTKPLDVALSHVHATPAFYLGSTLLLSGALLRLWCFRELGRFFTFVATIQKDHKLITSGPYAYVRHPAYSGLALSLVGFVGCHLTPGTWLRECGLLDTRMGVAALVGLMSAGVGGLLYFCRRAGLEDEALRKQFPGEWDRWARRVRYKIVPGVW